MELIALLLLAPLVFSNGSPEVLSPVPVVVEAQTIQSARVVQSESGTVINPPVDLRYTMVVVRHTSIGSNGRSPSSSDPASSLADRVEVIVSAP